MSASECRHCGEPIRYVWVERDGAHEHMRASGRWVVCNGDGEAVHDCEATLARRKAEIGLLDELYGADDDEM